MSDKIVFILGAGFSKEAGAPLIDDFMMVARNVFANRKNELLPLEQEFFSNVFSYHEDLSKARVKIKFDVDNIEDLFSIIDMNITHSKDSQALNRTRESLIYLILKTLDMMIKEDKYELYYEFMKKLYSEASDFSFITFNYDLILEKALENGNCRFNYCHMPDKNPIKFDQKKVLKLHGSSNWLLCTECNNLTVLPTKAIAEAYNRTCPIDNKRTIPLLVPPTWSKRLDPIYLKNVWYYAFEELSNANQIVLIGYSLPETDVYFKHFLTLCLKNNIKLKKIMVIDIDRTVEERFKAFLEENYSRRYFTYINKKFSDAYQSLTFQD